MGDHTDSDDDCWMTCGVQPSEAGGGGAYCGRPAIGCIEKRQASLPTRLWPGAAATIKRRNTHCGKRKTHMGPHLSPEQSNYTAGIMQGTFACFPKKDRYMFPH